MSVIDERGPDFRDDDISIGYCPTCGETCSGVTLNGGGYCPSHGRVWVNWEPPETVPVEEEDE